MEAVVDQTLSNVQLADAGLLFQRTNIQNTLVRHAAIATGVEHRESGLQTRCDVVRIEDRHLAGLLQPFRTHHADIHPADWQDRGAAERCRRDRALTGQHAFDLHHAVTRYKRRQVRFHTDWTHTRAATAVRNAEGFVQVQVRHVRADKAWRGDAHLSVHVGTIEVNLAAVLVHDFAHFTDSLFVHTVSGRIGHHDAGELIAGLFCFRTQVRQIDVAVLIAGDNHHFHPCHLGRGRVGAVRRAWDQADIAMAFVAALVIVTDCQQARVLTLSAGVWLHAKSVVAGQLHQPVGELVDHHMVAFRLICRAERVQLSEFRPGDRDHLSGGIQLHGAGAQRDHRLVQGQILALQRVHVAHHLGFAVVAVKDRMGEDRVVAQHGRLNGAAVMRHLFVEGSHIQTVTFAQQDVEQHLNIFASGGLIQGDAHGIQDVAAQVNLCGFSTGQHRRFVGHFDTQGIEEVRVAQFLSFLLQAAGQDIGQTMNAAGDTLQASRAVEDGVQAGDVSQQHLRGTDVGVRFLTTNVLLASLHRHAQGGVTGGIF